MAGVWKALAGRQMSADDAAGSPSPHTHPPHPSIQPPPPIQENILYSQYFLLRRSHAETEHALSFTVPLSEPVPPQFFVRVVSDRCARPRAPLRPACKTWGRRGAALGGLARTASPRLCFVVARPRLLKPLSPPKPFKPYKPYKSSKPYKPSNPPKPSTHRAAGWRARRRCPSPSATCCCPRSTPRPRSCSTCSRCR